jgi:hypothetical protein
MVLSLMMLLYVKLYCDTLRDVAVQKMENYVQTYSLEYLYP